MDEFLFKTALNVMHHDKIGLMTYAYATSVDPEQSDPLNCSPCSERSILNASRKQFRSLIDYVDLQSDHSLHLLQRQ
jgi:hypothetical protein